MNTNIRKTKNILIIYNQFALFILSFIEGFAITPIFMDTCLFCKIAAKHIPAQIIHEDAETVAFLDIHPRAPGHAMVISKTHSESILDLPDRNVEPLFLSVKKVTAMISRTFLPDGFTIGVNHGKVSGQAVDHLHIHIIPRFTGDGGTSLHSIVDNAPKDPLQEIAEKIRSNRE